MITIGNAVLGILAHVDAGKTTLSEAILYRCGIIRQKGRVDNGDAYLDTDASEKSRGITIYSKPAVSTWNGLNITLLDTPGHTDFSPEAEQAMVALDAALLVISAPEGIQSHTVTLWNILKRRSIPVLVFVNKTDMNNPGQAELIASLLKRFGNGFVNFSADPDIIAEEQAFLSEEAMQCFENRGHVDINILRREFGKRHMFPVLFGSALKSTGIDELLNTLRELLVPEGDAADPFGAVVYKISRDNDGNRLTNIRVFSGSISVRDSIGGEKITGIRLYSGLKYSSPDSANPGDVVALLGPKNTYSGQGLGIIDDTTGPSLTPVMTCSIIPTNGTDIHSVLLKLKPLSDENPLLHIRFNSRTSEICADIMGDVSLEILHDSIRDRFGLEVTFSEPSVSYREKPLGVVEGVGHFEPLRHYAEVHVFVEPLPTGAGVIIDNKCPDNVLPKEKQDTIIKVLSSTEFIGPLTGSPIADAKITLIAARDHEKHTEGGDMREAAWRSVYNGLRMVGTQLLEPFLNFTINVPDENVGRVLSDLSRMSAQFDQPYSSGGISTLSGTVTARAYRNYSVDISGFTGGYGSSETRFAGYMPAENPLEIAEAIGYDPDSDLEHTADSVFCRHGAGFVVPWDQVLEYAHLPLLKDKRDLDDTYTDTPVVPVKTQYRDAETEDKELLKIYERTYGPVKRDLRAVLRTVEDPVIHAAVPRERRDEYLLIDAYNIIFDWEELRNVAHDNMDAAREVLIRRLSNYQGYVNNNIIVVFDAYKVKGAVHEVEHLNNITVVYTKEAETADMYIERAVRRLTRSRRVRVATNDSLEQLIILGAGAQRIASDRFHEELRLVEKAIDDIVEVL